MMKARAKDMTKQQTALIYAAVVAAIFALGYAVFFMPLVSRLNEAVAERESLHRRMAEVRRNLPHSDFLYAEKCLVHDREISKGIETIAAQGKQMSIDFISISLGSREDQASCSILPLVIEARSSYKQIGLFLDSLRRMKRYIVKVKSVRIFPDKEKPGMLYSKIVLSVYLKAGRDAK